MQQGCYTAPRAQQAHRYGAARIMAWHNHGTPGVATVALAMNITGEELERSRHPEERREACGMGGAGNSHEDHRIHWQANGTAVGER